MRFSEEYETFWLLVEKIEFNPLNFEQDTIQQLKKSLLIIHAFII